MAIALEITNSFADALNRAVRIDRYEEVLIQMDDDIVVDFQSGGQTQIFEGRAAVRAWLSSLNSAWIFIPHRSRKTDHVVFGSFEIRGGSPIPSFGEWTFELSDENLIKHIRITGLP